MRQDDGWDKVMMGGSAMSNGRVSYASRDGECQVFNASEAKKLAAAAKAIDGDYKRAETNETLSYIRTAAKSGAESVMLSRSLDPIVVKRLELLGFKVVVSEGQRSDETTVSW